MLFVLLSIMSAGFLLLISYWKPDWRLYLTHSKCCLSMANKVLLKDNYGTKFVETVVINRKGKINTKTAPDLKLANKYRYFWHKHLKYYYDEKSMSFLPVEMIDEGLTFCTIINRSHGASFEERKIALSWYGSNKIDVDVKSYIRLFFEECADPFYIFQVCSCILWFSDEYYYYAGAIVFISLTSIIVSIYQTRKHLQTLHDMIAKSSIVSVLQPNNEVIDIQSEDLVPGDVIVLPKHGSTLHCDAVLINGTVIVNESMLTGESIPVTKTPISKPQNHADSENEVFDSVKHKRHTLFCGTEILQTRYYGNEHVCAVVVKTGFTSMKGGLIRSILFPKPVDFQFFNDAIRFVAVLGIFALLGLIFSVYVLLRNHASVHDIVDKALDVITIAVPPALPAAMSVGTVYALQRLKKVHIFCISPSRVNICGKIKLFCFDKTGTLTEDGLDFCGIIRSNGHAFENLESSLFRSESDHITMCMASCHSLTILDGNICGDPLDEKMFQATNWEIEEAGLTETERYGNIVPTIVKPRSSAVDSIRIKYLEDESLPLEVAIIKQFTFSSELQRMSVIVRRLGMKSMEVYVKGSPEMVASLCDSATIPSDFEECLMNYTKQGYRVLAMGYKMLSPQVHWHKVQHFQRSQAESDLHFLGFIVFKNVLKQETTPVIEQLYKAQIRPVMVTGDNILTAISVARECGMIKPCEKIMSITMKKDTAGLHFSVIGELEHHIDVDSVNEEKFYSSTFLQRNYHLAVTGKVFSVIQNSYPLLYERLLVCGTIFARMLPDQKTMLVESLQQLGYGVGMCGDGANDCGALKRAHAGISLSEAEASVASPFTSKIPNISCVLHVIKEGRCALVTSFNIFKYMALYSMIQYSSVLMLYDISSNLSDLQYLYIDLFIIMPIAITMSRTGPSDTLVSQRPLGRLVHPVVLFSLIFQIFTQTGFQVFVYLYAKTIPLTAYNSNNHSDILKIQNTVLFVYTAFQYIIVALIFSVGRPYRKPFYSNIAFLISCVILMASNCVMTVKPIQFLQESFKIYSIDYGEYYMVIFGLLLCNLLCSHIIDNVLLDTKCIQRLLRWTQRKKGPKNKYKLILNDIANDSSWPPASSYTEKDML